MLQKWSPDLAYAIGIIATDGNLSPDGRHINITSKDKELLLSVKSCLNLKNSIGRKSRSKLFEKKYYVIQFGDVLFYRFLENIGIHPAKSKTIGEVATPKQFFRDFLRGCIDGDGNIGTFKHPQSNHLQLRVRLCSASKTFLQWIHQTVVLLTEVRHGWISQTRDVYSLAFGTEESVKILKFIYYRNSTHKLLRKYRLAQAYMGGW